MTLSRRSFLCLGAAGFAAAAAPVVFLQRPAKTQILVVGGGSGGAQTALSLAQADAGLSVTLLERDPTSLLRRGQAGETLAGVARPMAPFNALQEAGVHVAVDEAMGVDWSAQSLHALSGRRFGFDQIVVAPGVSPRHEEIEGYDPQTARLMPHAWLREEALASLKTRLTALPQGGVVVLRVPAGEMRYAKGPYKRATAMAEYLAQINPRAKVILLDGKTDFADRSAYEARWAALPAGMVEWRSAENGGLVQAVSADAQTVTTSHGVVHGDLLHYIPAQQAGRFASAVGLADGTGWCPTDLANGASLLQKSTFVIGDAARTSGQKTADQAGQQARACAATLLA